MLGEDMLTEGVKINRSYPIITDGSGEAYVFLTARAQGGVYLSNGFNSGGSGNGMFVYAPSSGPYINTPETTCLLDLNTAQDWSSAKDIASLNLNNAMVEPIAAGFEFKPSVNALQQQGNIFIRGDYQKKYAVQGVPVGANIYELSDMVCRTTAQNGLKTRAIPLMEGVHGCLIPLQDNCKMATRQIRWNDDPANGSWINYQGAPGAVGQLISSLGAYAVGGQPSTSIWPNPGVQAYTNLIKEQYTHFSTVMICFTGCAPGVVIGNLELSMHLECTSQDKGLDRAQPAEFIPHPFTLQAANRVMQKMDHFVPMKDMDQRSVMRSASRGLGSFFGPIVDLAKDTALGFAKKLLPF